MSSHKTQCRACQGGQGEASNGEPTVSYSELLLRCMVFILQSTLTGRYVSRQNPDPHPFLRAGVQTGRRTKFIRVPGAFTITILLSRPGPREPGRTACTIKRRVIFTAATTRARTQRRQKDRALPNTNLSHHCRLDWIKSRNVRVGDCLVADNIPDSPKYLVHVSCVPASSASRPSKNSRRSYVYSIESPCSWIPIFSG